MTATRPAATTGTRLAGPRSAMIAVGTSTGGGALVLVGRGRGALGGRGRGARLGRGVPGGTWRGARRGLGRRGTRLCVWRGGEGATKACFLMELELKF